MGIINNESIWIQMLHDRNNSSHTYNKEIADLIFQNIELYVPHIKDAIEKLTKII